jgi:hypothetical protein
MTQNILSKNREGDGRRLKSGLTRRDYNRLLLNRRRQDFHERTGQHINFARIAKRHRKNLLISLIVGAESRAWSKEQALDVYRHTVSVLAIGF